MIYLHKEKNVESNFGHRPTTLEKAKSSVLSVQVELLSPERQIIKISMNL